MALQNKVAALQAKNRALQEQLDCSRKKFVASHRRKIAERDVRIRGLNFQVAQRQDQLERMRELCAHLEQKAQELGASLESREHEGQVKIEEVSSEINDIIPKKLTDV